LCELETFPSVFHLTSTIGGRLSKGKGSVDLVKACFPGGSITGAPKVRAMEIIEEMEPCRRAVYTGAIGYVGFDGSADLSVAIRTATVSDGKVRFHAGGGIVYDSDPGDEYDETLHKATGLMNALGAASPPGGRL
jgi:para-aminobenzoate synthetase component 1